MSNITKVYLLNTPLDNDYQHTLYFSGVDTQYSYFSKRKVHSFTDFNYQRKDSFIRVPLHYDECAGCNYVMYQNSEDSSKWYYAFITDIKFIDKGRTDIYIETDVIQTWMFDYEVKTSFVEREHVDDDTIGLHTLPENIQLGEYVSNGYEKDDNLKIDSNYVVIGSTATLYYDGTGKTFKGEDWIGGIYCGIYSGNRYYMRKAVKSGDEVGPSVDITSYMQKLADEGKIEGLSSLFLAPNFLLQYKDLAIDGKYYHYVVDESNTPRTYEKLVAKQNTINGYTPKNNKLLTFPYQYLLVNNGNGTAVEYQYELFSDQESCEFLIRGVLSPGCSIRMIPKNYKGTEFNEIEGINLGKYPQCNWATDQYTNWLTQNGVNIVTGGINSVGNAVMSGALMGPVGAVVGGVNAITSIANSVNQMVMAERQPPQTSGNINCGDVVTASDNNTFHFYKMSIKSENAKIVDEFFSMFGYKINRAKIPNKNHRENYWFTKTIDVNIVGGIPKNDMNKIKTCYNNGITFWKYPSNFRDYSVSNNIVE